MSAYVVILNTSDKYWLMLHKDGPHAYSVLGWNNLDKALAYFEEGYRQSHQRNYEGSMSACINYIQFQPRIVEFADLADLENRLLPHPLPDVPEAKDIMDALIATKHPEAVSRVPCRVSHISGRYDCLPLINELAQPFWAAGRSPSLI
jgi:hypothetical protein